MSLAPANGRSGLEKKTEKVKKGTQSDDLCGKTNTRCSNCSTSLSLLTGPKLETIGSAKLIAIQHMKT